MEKIVDLVSQGKYDKLKDVLESKLAKKVKDKVEEKKLEFVEKMKSKKGEKHTTSSESEG
jgi:hypothetical protein